MQNVKLKFKIVFLTILFLGVFGLPSETLVKLGLVKSSWAAGTCGSSSDGQGQTHCSGASPWTSDSLSKDDMNYCINTCASNGDTVYLPAGDVTWTSGMGTSKAISIIGAGKDATIIRMAPGSAPFFMLSINQPSPAYLTRVSGIYFYNPVRIGWTYQIAVYLTGYDGNRNVRIDHNKFENMYETIYVARYIDPVVDNNEFINCDVGVYLVGDNGPAWTRPIVPGTADATFVEDNTFIKTDFVGCATEPGVYQSDARRTVYRHNIVHDDCTEWGGSDLDAHGDAAGQRGTVLNEIYENVSYHYSGWGFTEVRGGSYLVWNNTYSCAVGQACYAVKVTDEEGWGPPDRPSRLITQWPAHDQVNNTFIWNNTVNGAPWDGVVIYGNNPPIGLDNILIQKDRDYFYGAPAASGQGYEKWGSYMPGDVGPKGGWASYPVEGAPMTFTSGASAYYPYTPYQYPHPLRSENPCTYTYSAWGACQLNGTQTRTYTALPVGCSGTPLPTSQSCEYVFSPNQDVEAEYGKLTSPMQKDIGGTYIYTGTEGQGSASFKFNITQAGQYKLEARVNSNNDSSRNSFYVGLDSESAQGNNQYTYALPLVGSFTWDDVNKVGNGISQPQYDPMIWALTQGIHTFTFYGREANAWLDQIRLVPTGTDTTPPSAPSGVMVN